MSAFPVISSLVESTTVVDTIVESSQGFMTTTKAELKLKSGKLIPQGASVTCTFTEGSDTTFMVAYGELSFRMYYASASKYLNKFKPAPSMVKLEKYVNDGICPTPLGNRTEPDGHGPTGEPSWLLVMGLI